MRNSSRFLGAALAAGLGFSISPAAAATDPPSTKFVTVAGDCIYPVPGSNAEGLETLALSFVPKLVGAGVDLLTGALEEAGKDKTFTQTVVAPLEFRPRCLQIARTSLADAAAMTAAPPTAESIAALTSSPFLVELYLRRSQDGSAMTIMPTHLEYGANIENGGSGGKERDLFLTLSFSSPGSDKAQTVTIPLGAHAPGSRNLTFAPVQAPGVDYPRYPLGVGASGWIAMPFVPDASRTKGAAGYTANPTKPVTVTVVMSETRPGSKLAATLASIIKASKSNIVDAADPEKRRQALEAERTARDSDLKALATATDTMVQKRQAYCALPDVAPLPARTSAAVAYYSAQIDAISKADQLSLPPPAFADPLVDYSKPQPSVVCS